MKKIGILTFHRAHNYGAMLQCYALSTYLTSIGNDVEVIDYYPSYFKKEYSTFNKSAFKSAGLKTKIVLLLDYFLKFFKQKKRSEGFSHFLNRLPLSKTYNENTVTYSGYDVVFVGSDQVWNQKLTHGVDLAFTGAISHEKCILASYAASTEMYDNIHELDGFYRSVLTNFDFVSVREKKLNKYCNSLIPGKSVHVLDPVLLLKKEQWQKVAKPPKESNYLLIYTVPQDPKVFEIASIIAKENNLRVVELVSKVRYFMKKGCNQVASPEEFLGYFSKANYIVTTSFHGTAFSILFEKPFCTVMLGRPVDERAIDLLSNIGIASRAVTDKNSLYNLDDIDYREVTNSLNILAAESKKYLMDVVSVSKKNG